MTNQQSLSIEITGTLPEQSASAAVAVCVFTDEPRVHPATSAWVRAVAEALARDDEFKGEAETSLLIHTQSANGAGVRRLLLLGLGSHADLNARTYSRVAATAVRRARGSHIKHLYFIALPFDRLGSTTRALVEGAVTGLYDNAFYRKREEEAASLERFTIVSSEEGEGLNEELERGRILGEAVNWARSLADEPGGTLPPLEFARRAGLMAGEFNLRVETLGAEEIRARGMGGLWGVGKGSDNPPQLIVIRYEPEGASDDEELWAFVGKGITFDTGGISLKHGLDMYEMKTDMAGGAAVLGAMRAIAALKPRRSVVGIVPAAENMPSGKAIKPGDVVKTLAGYTIEVVDTDAEGRLVLADGIAYAKQLKASRIVDVATLTGSIIIALGDQRTGLFSNDEEWAGRIERAAARACEPLWRMPVSDDYKQRIESVIADFKNYGGRPDATAAALLLSKFAGGTPWAHLDIAGTSWLDHAAAYAPKGSTGAGVRTLVELVCNES
jgi:leucyl aminopeptidase